MRPPTGRQHRPHTDHGFTLTEIIVAVALLSMLMVMVTTAIVKGMNLTRNMGVRLDNINQGQAGMNAATKALRTAVLPDQLVNSVCVGCADTALIQATPTTVTFYANLNNTGQGPALMTYYAEQDPTTTLGNLVQTSQAPQVLTGGRYSFCVVGTTGCVVTKRTIARGLPWPATTMFQYYDFDARPLPATALTDENLAQVDSIDITLAVQTNKVQTAAPTNTIVTRVQLPNANINVLIQPGGTP